MALSTFVGTFRSLTTDSIGTTYTLTPGFETKAGIVFHTGRGDASDASGGATMRRSIGFFTSTTNRFCTGSMSVDAAAAGSGNEFLNNAAVSITAAADSTTVDGQIDVSSITSTTCVFVVDDVMPVDSTFGAILFGGSDITNATVVEYDLGSGTGTIDITSVGFQGDMLFVAGTNELGPSPVVDAAGGQMFFGACTGTGDEHVWWGGMDQGSATADTAAYSLAGDLHADCNGGITAGGSMQNRVEFSAWLSNGWRFNKLLMGRNGINGIALVIQGGNWTVGDFTTLATTGPITESGFGYTPNGVLVVSALRAVSTAPNQTADDQLSIGAADASTQHAQAMVDDNGVADMEVATAVDFDKVYVNLDVADTVVGLISVTSFDTDGITFNQDDADPSANFAWYVACGNPAVGGGSISPYYSNYYTRVVAA